MELLLSWVQGVPTWLLGIVGLVFAYYLYTTWTHTMFKELGFPHAKPLPFIGTALPAFKKGIHVTDVENRKTYKGNCYGSFFGRTPSIMLNNTEAVKHVFIKDFNAAPNHWNIGLRGILKFSLIESRNERWHNQRTALSPAFTASKLRRMMPWTLSVADNFTKSIKQKAETSENFEMKERCGLFTMDAIAGTGFGIDADSFSNEENEFIKSANIMFKSISIKSPGFLIVLFFRFLIPLLEFLGIGMFRKSVLRYFERVIEQAMVERKKENDEDNTTKRTDLLQQMVNRLVTTPVDKSKERTDEIGVWYEKSFTETEVKANGILLLLAGYDTTSTSMSFLCYNLAVHPEVQDRVIAEIDTVLQGKAPDYDTAGKLEYLDQCLAESLRLFPPVIRTERQLERPTTIDGKHVPAGMLCVASIYAIHHDPEMWPEPEKFDPERFSPENRQANEDLLYMPFGLGPRMCVAKRLAELEIKIAVARLLQTVRLTTCDKTEIPLMLTAEATLKPKNGIHLAAELRQ